MKKNDKKLFGSLMKMAFICVVLTCVFAFTSCDSGSSLHNCAFGGIPVKTSSDNTSQEISIQSFVDRMQEAISADKNNKLLMFYLASNVKLEKEVILPEGRFVGICKGAFDIENLQYTVVDSNGDGIIEDAGIFTFVCGMHGGHGDRAYTYVDQSIIDLFGRSGVNMFERFGRNNTSINIALKEDVRINPEYTSLKIPSGYTVGICTNDYQFTDNLGIGTSGGVLREVDCKAEYYHICSYLADDAYVASQSNLNYLISVLAGAHPGDMVCVYLSEDISWEGEISAPKGVTVMICLNGFSANGKIKNGGSSKFAEYNEPVGASGSLDNQTGVESDIGDIFFYQCSTHLCLDICDNGMMLGYNEKSIEWNNIALQSIANPISPEVVYCMLEEDVDLTVIDGIDMNVCVNGCRNRTEQRSEQGRIYYYNCASSHDCAVINLINTMVGGTSDSEEDESSAAAVTNRYLLASQADEINQIFSKLPYGLHSYSLTADLVAGGTVYAPSNTVVAICTNGYSTEGVSFAQNVIVYECNFRHCDYLDAEIAAFDQGVFDLFGVIISAMGMNSLKMNFDYSIAIMEDVVIPYDVEVQEGYVLTMCSCGYNLSATEGNSLTGYVAVHSDCEIPVENSSKLCSDCGQHMHANKCVCDEVVEKHICAVPELVGMLSQYSFTSSPLNTDSVAEINRVFGSINPDSKYSPFYYLTADVVGGGTITLPESAVVCICLNGYSLDDVVIDENGGTLFIYECREHFCTECGVQTYAFDQGVFDLFDALMEFQYPITIYSDMVFGLLEDVTVREDLFAVGENSDARLYICTCGYQAQGFTDDVSILHTDVKSYSRPAACNHDSWQTFNYATFREITSRDGTVILPPGSYYYCLENDFQLPVTLTVTPGVDIHICLNGYMLYSPFIWFDSEMFGNGYPEAQSMSLANVLEGGALNIHDCSESQSGEMAVRFLRKNGEILLMLSENNEGFSAIGEGLSAIFGTYFSNIATNQGTINIYGGTLNGMVGLMNLDNGVINVYRGRINAGFVGVMQGAILEDNSSSDPQLYLGDGAVVSGAGAGVLGIVGDVDINGAVINSGSVGVVSGLTIANGGITSAADTSITINGGSINLGNTESIQSVYSTIGLAQSGTEIVDFSSLLGDDSSLYVAMVTSGTINMESDFDVNASVTYNESLPYIDIYMLGYNSVNASADVEGKYSVLVDGVANVGDSKNFVPIEGCTSTYNSDGDMVIIPTPSGNAYADINNMSVSTQGDVILNLYVTVYDEHIFDKAEVTVIYDGVKYTSPIRDLEPETMLDGSTGYRISIPVSAKDYKEKISYYFVLPQGYSYETWAELAGIQVNNNDVSIEYYLDYIINYDGENSYIEESKPLAIAMKNYCEAAAGYFGVSDGYTVPDDMADDMQSAADFITNEENGFKPTREGDYATSSAVLTGTTVMLRSPFALRVYFKMTDGSVLESVMVNDCALTLDGAVIADENGTMYRYYSTENEKEPYCIEISGIYAKDLSNKFVYDFGDWSFEYSVMSYAYSILTSSKSSAAAKDTVKALTVYYHEALNYYNANHSTEGEEGGAE